MARKIVPAVSYLRVSGKAQISGDGFPRQREVIARFARSHQYKVIDEYRDEGVSGTTELEHREGLAALFARVESDGLQAVLVERADRLARDLLVGEVILGQFGALGVRVVAADSGVDLTTGDDDPTRTLIRQVLGAVSQFEKSVIVLKLRAARDRARRSNGRCEGRKPFGIKPGEAETLKRMKQLRHQVSAQTPMSFASIAEVLNGEKRKTRQGDPWVAGSVRKILRRVIS